jgi:hypothetical protein
LLYSSIKRENWFKTLNNFNLIKTHNLLYFLSG